MITVADLIKDFGGVGAFAQIARAPTSTVNTWRHRNNLPANLDVLIVEAAAHKGLRLSYEDLARMRFESARRKAG